MVQIFEYSLIQKEYTDWSRKLQKQGLHHLWLERDTPVTHITFSPKNPAHIFMHDTFMFCIIDQSLVRDTSLPRFKTNDANATSLSVKEFVCLCFHMQPLPEAKTMLYNQMTLRSLPEQERLRQSHAFKICKTFKVPSSH